MPAAFFSNTVAGGVLVRKVKLRSLQTVITTGRGKPCSTFWVAALNCLQNSMMLTPCWPSAGPTGGLGLVCLAFFCFLFYAWTFFVLFFFFFGCCCFVPPRG